MKLHEIYFELKQLREYEESTYFAMCKQFDCPRKQILCYKIARRLCAPNKVCQRAIDREIDAVAWKYDMPTEEPNNYPGQLDEDV
jgi:hypothetical protein